MVLIDGNQVKKSQKIFLTCHICQLSFLRVVGTLIKSRASHGQDLCKSCVTITYNKTRPLEVRKKSGEGGRRACAGKKLEEIVGEERAQSIKKVLSSQRMGDKNHNYGGVHQKFKVRVGTLESQFGIEKAAAIKKKLSAASSGENNPMFGVPSPKKCGTGISGHYGTFYFRSLLEFSYILHLENKNIDFVSCDGKKAFKFSYELNNVSRTYTPDFYIPETNTIIEVKPFKLVSSAIHQLKRSAVIALGYNFVFMTENEINRISKSELKILINNQSVTIDENKLRMLRF